MMTDSLSAWTVNIKIHSREYTT